MALLANLLMHLAGIVVLYYGARVLLPSLP
jgi:hypothetical protein